MKGLIWMLSAAAAGAIFALGLPFFAKQIPFSMEKKAADLLHFETWGCKKNPSSEGHIALKKLVKRIYPLFPDDNEINIDVEVIMRDEKNAFAFLGGHIFFHDALVKDLESPDEFAGILAHEIEHVRNRHVIQGVFVRFLTFGVAYSVFSGNSAGSELTQALLNMKFSRQQESEADEKGFERLARAGVEVSGLEHFFQRMAKETTIPSLISDHPDNGRRAQLAEKYRSKKNRPILDAAEWAALKKICE